MRTELTLAQFDTHSVELSIDNQGDMSFLVFEGVTKFVFQGVTKSYKAINHTFDRVFDPKDYEDFDGECKDWDQHSLDKHCEEASDALFAIDLIKKAVDLQSPALQYSIKDLNLWEDLINCENRANAFFDDKDHFEDPDK